MMYHRVFIAFLVVLCVHKSDAKKEESQSCPKTTGDQDWCTWTSYKCCPGYGCCGPESTCCWRLGREGKLAEGCCTPEEQCCSSESGGKCCPTDARCCTDSRGVVSCCTKTSSVDRVLFGLGGFQSVVLALLVFYHYVWDRHNPKADICSCSKLICGNVQSTVRAHLSYIVHNSRPRGQIINRCAAEQ
eukprot:sb/3471256/